MLLENLLHLLEGWRPAFLQKRTCQRAIALALGLLCGLGRRTVTRAICFNNRQHQDWAPITSSSTAVDGSQRLFLTRSCTAPSANTAQNRLWSPSTTPGSNAQAKKLRAPAGCVILSVRLF